MRATILTTAITLAVAATSAGAYNCKEGLTYCASTLKRLGDYTKNIEAALIDAEIVGVKYEVLFRCVEATGALAVAGVCSLYCKDGGPGHSDYCTAY
ncbi:hypothetical protein B0H16DRAFT_1631854 [Mycena metata]|uniref:Hydrophobin n=1 Tax=Mycena metata TaxID=1033252 RepID=A0AAD7H028_9AGAR|nr:hypothetical protein B0H16DRAFT_655166 [Mycena metata]KAJ7709168.1 hypothetical protein B0H16DRAFT_1631854 [Mycena metata]